MNAKDIRTPPHSATPEETGAVSEPGAGAAGARSDDRVLDSLESLLGEVVRDGPAPFSRNCWAASASAGAPRWRA